MHIFPQTRQSPSSTQCAKLPSTSIAGASYCPSSAPSNAWGELTPSSTDVLLWQNTTFFFLAQHELGAVTPLAIFLVMDTWIRSNGYLPWLQLGPSPRRTYLFFGTSCKIFSLLRKQALVLLPPTTWPRPTPSVALNDVHGHPLERIHSFHHDMANFDTSPTKCCYQAGSPSGGFTTHFRLQGELCVLATSNTKQFKIISRDNMAQSHDCKRSK